MKASLERDARSCFLALERFRSIGIGIEPTEFHVQIRRCVAFRALTCNDSRTAGDDGGHQRGSSTLAESRKVQCVSKFCVMVTHRRRSLMINAVSVTRGSFLHDQWKPFHSRSMIDNDDDDVDDDDSTFTATDDCVSRALVDERFV